MVYLARDQEFIKIGLAQESNLLRRWMELQIGNPREIEFRVFDLAGERMVEKELHEKFAHLKVRGEWFRMDDDLEAMWDKAAKAEERKPLGRPPVVKIRAIKWVAEQLADGPLLASTIRARGKEAGFTPKTIWRAGKALGIQRQERMPSQITWELPA